MSLSCTADTTKIKSIYSQTQPNAIYYIELHVSTYLKPSSVLQIVFKTFWGRTIHFVSPLDLINIIKVVNVLIVNSMCVDRGYATTVTNIVYFLLPFSFRICHSVTFSQSNVMLINLNFLPLSIQIRKPCKPQI